MYIRSGNLDEYPESSFEDMELSFGKSNRNSEQEIAPDSVSSLGRSHGVLPTPSSTSSNSTTFSDMRVKRLSVGSSSRTDEEGEEEEEDFLNDFQEFRGKKEDFDDAFKAHFQLNDNNCGEDNNYHSKNKRKGMDLSEELNEKLSLEPGGEQNNDRVRRQRSMVELKTTSSDDLSGIDPNAKIRCKKSMSALSHFTDTAQEDGGLEGDKFLQSRRSNSLALNDFEEEREEEPDDKDFVFTESLIQPQFLSKDLGSPLKVSLSQYDVIRDDSLLTPRLHRRHRDWNSKDQLHVFKERTKNRQVQQEHQRKKKSHHGHYPRSRIACRIKIIKQEIDQNIPIRNGRMYYNPETLKWEGNEQILDKFDRLESEDKKPLLIRERGNTHDSSSIDGSDTEQSSSKRTSLSKTRNKKCSNKKIVGRMMFDEENLKWINANEDEEQEDPFVDVQDMTPLPIAPNDENENTLKATSASNGNGANSFLRSHSQICPSSVASPDRVSPSAAMRYHSVAFIKSDNVAPQFQLNSKELEKFWHEENKWNNKVGTWFIMGDCGADTRPNNLRDLDEVKNPRSFMYEIRNMVLNSTR